MRTLVLYESMYGNTHLVAASVADGLASFGPVRTLPVHAAGPDDLRDVDLVVVGAPTHARDLPTPASRTSAIEGAATDDGWSRVTLDAEARGTGVREWIEELDGAGGARTAAAFDTRVAAPAILVGRASKAIASRLRDRGWSLVAPPESFIVDTHQRLRRGEIERARSWGADLGARASRSIGSVSG